MDASNKCIRPSNLRQPAWANTPGHVLNFQVGHDILVYLKIATPRRNVDMSCNVGVLSSNRQAYICSKLVTLVESYNAAGLLSESVRTI